MAEECGGKKKQYYSIPKNKVGAIKKQGSNKGWRVGDIYKGFKHKGGNRGDIHKEVKGGCIINKTIKNILH